MFSGLFNINEEESAEEVEEEVESFSFKWGFLIFVDSVIRFTNHTYDYIMNNMGVLEMLNLVIYIKDKRAEDERLIEIYKNK